MKATLPTKPPTPPPSRRRAITLEDAYWEYAKEIGHGNASEGLRIALRKMLEEELQCQN
jgi:hypothetical protein